MFLINGKIRNKYPRQNIEEPVVGAKFTVYKIVDKIPIYKSNVQTIEKSNIEETEELYDGLEHIKVAYQNYIVKDISDNILKQKFKEEFGTWLDNEYPLWRRQKHFVELTRSPLEDKRYDELISWQDWEFEQRRIFKEEIENKTYNFNFYPKN